MMMCEQCKMFRWYADGLSNELRRQAEFAETDAERQTKVFAAHSVDLVFGEWPKKFLMYPSVPSQTKQRPTLKAPRG